MNDILFLEPLFKERIWGGNALRDQFGYELPSKKFGECWAISAHTNGDCKIINGKFQGRTLSDVYKNEKKLFNYYASDHFPLLVKILDANDDLSVQVHPNDRYAKKYANDLGKTECWYVLNAKKDAYIVYGHRANSKEEFMEMIEMNQWDDLLIKKHVVTGDFIYVPAGTVHALGKGLLILETQQSSDTTYRLYDYGRKDNFGNERELHIEESIEVATIPHINSVPRVKYFDLGDTSITRYVHNDFFTVEKWDINSNYNCQNEQFKLMSVIDGYGQVNGNPIKKGDHFIITTNINYIQLEGKMTIITSYV